MDRDNFDPNNETEYVMLDPNITTILYSNTLRLTIESTGKTIQFHKEVVSVGRDAACDLLLDTKKLLHASRLSSIMRVRCGF